jgi:predicted GH43/DUF377 family glycosyl hydrolase
LAKAKWHRELFERHPANPILTVDAWPYPANAVFNAGAVLVGQTTLLLVRVEDRRGISHLCAARSADGVFGWQIDQKPTFCADPANYPEELYGVEDPRITFVSETGEYLIAYTAYSQSGPLVSLARTRDFVSFERLGAAMAPDDKDAAVFPVRFDGRYAMVHRPSATPYIGGAHIWLSFSPDLTHWGEHQILLPCRQGGWWDANKIGLSPPPLLTDEGWLLMYHGVRQTIAGGVYRLGLALLDAKDPRRVLRRADEWAFGIEESYERQGDVADVVFPCGWVVEGDELRLYYGAADTSMALATARVSEVLDWLRRHSPPA